MKNKKNLYSIAMAVATAIQLIVSIIQLLK